VVVVVVVKKNLNAREALMVIYDHNDDLLARRIRMDQTVTCWIDWKMYNFYVIQVNLSLIWILEKL
tara:strand:+ start:146 stop:343 length:198 start_codon:yes stop_codon:yes gene_type:complete